MSPYLFFLQVDQNLTLESIIEEDSYPFESYDPNDPIYFRNVGKTTWIKMLLTNQSALYNARIIEIYNPNTNNIQLYKVKNKQIEIRYPTIGNYQPFNKREIASLSPSYQVELTPNESAYYYLRVPPSASSMDMNFNMSTAHSKIPIKIWHPAKFWKSYQNTYGIYGLFFGFLLLYSISLFLILSVNHKTNGNWVYLIFLLLVSMVMASNSGIGFQFLWPNNTIFEAASRQFFIKNYQIFSLLGLFQLLKSNTKWVKRVFYFHFAIAFTMSFAGFFYHLFDLPVVWVIFDLSNLLLLWLQFLHILYILYHIKYYKDNTQIPLLIIHSLIFISFMAIILNFYRISYIPFVHIALWITVILGILVLAFTLISQIYRTNKTISLQREKSIQAVEMGIHMERNRLKTDIHDGLGLRMSLTSLNVSKLEAEIEKPEIKSQLSQVRNQLAQMHEEVRNIINDVQPEDIVNLGLLNTIGNYVDHLNAHSPIKCSYFVKTDFSINNEYVKLHIYRIIQELLNNAIKHSKAKTISLQLFYDKDLKISIEDDGIGFNYDQAMHSTGKNSGLNNLEIRVKVLESEIKFYSNKEYGTLIELLIPESTLHLGANQKDYFLAPN